MASIPRCHFIQTNDFTLTQNIYPIYRATLHLSQCFVLTVQKSRHLAGMIMAYYLGVQVLCLIQFSCISGKVTHKMQKGGVAMIPSKLQFLICEMGNLFHHTAILKGKKHVYQRTWKIVNMQNKFMMMMTKKNSPHENENINRNKS